MTRSTSEIGYKEKEDSKMASQKNTEVTAKLKQREIEISKAYESQAGSVGKGKGTCERGVK